MFHNRSFNAFVVLAAMALVTLIFGTAIGTLPTGNQASDTSRAMNLIDWFLQHGGSGHQDDASNAATAVIPAQPKSYADLKDAQLEQKDAQQFGSANITVGGEEESYYAMQKEQRAMQKDLRDATKSIPSVVSDPIAPARREGYAALKEAQLEQRDAAQLGIAIRLIHGVPRLNGCNLDRNEPDC